jgi:hypothetical protein
VPDLTAAGIVATVEALLGVPPGYPVWRIADIARRKRILATWLSAVQASGRELPPAPAEYLARARARMASLYEVSDHVSAAPGLTVIKGARIAAHLPAGVLRESGDVDIVAADQHALWRCVLDLRQRHHAIVQTVSVLRDGGGLHAGAALKWPAGDGYLDKPLGVDVTTCAFAGDFRGVPVRAEPVADTDLCSLFAVAEERFQRRFRTKDLLDLAVLARVLDARFGNGLVDAIGDLAGTLCLAPELRQLIKKTAEWVDLPPRWDAVVAALDPPAAQERALRRPNRGGMHELWFGFPLDDRPSGATSVTIREFDGGELALTPVGTCLLVGSRTISHELYEKARAEAATV